MDDKRFEVVTYVYFRHVLPSYTRIVQSTEVVSRPAWALELTTGVIPPSRYFIDAATGAILDTDAGPPPEDGPWRIDLPKEVLTLPADSAVASELEPLTAKWLKELGYAPNQEPATIQTLDNRHFRALIGNSYVFLWRRGESRFMLFRRPDVLATIVTGGDMAPKDAAAQNSCHRQKRSRA